MSLAGAFQRAYKSAVLDTILLQRAERIAASYPPSGRHRIQEPFQMGCRRVAAATDLVGSHPVAAAVLYRDASIAYIGAIVAARGETIELGRDDVKRAFELLDDVRSELPSAPRGFEKA